MRSAREQTYFYNHIFYFKIYTSNYVCVRGRYQMKAKARFHFFVVVRIARARALQDCCALTVLGSVV